MPKIFISFVQEDNAVAEAVQQLLREEFRDTLNHGDVFLSSDRWVLRPGENWMDRIRQELAECALVISLLSKRSIDRRWINFEGGAAWISDKLQPVRFGNLIMANIPRPYSDLIVVDLRTDPYGLLQAVNEKLTALERAQLRPGQLPPPPRRGPNYLTLDDERANQLRWALDGFVDEP